MQSKSGGCRVACVCNKMQIYVRADIFAEPANEELQSISSSSGGGSNRSSYAAPKTFFTQLSAKYVCRSCWQHHSAMAFDRVSRHPCHIHIPSPLPSHTECIIYIFLERKFTNASPLSFATISFIFFGTQDTIINSSCALTQTHIRLPFVFQ